MLSSTPPYVERLTAPLTWWLVGAGLVTAVWWAFFVATPMPVVAVATLVAAVVVVAGLWTFGSVRVVVDDRALSVGRASLPLQYVGAVTALGREAVGRAMGVEADARAFTVYRPYCAGAVQIMVADQRDPTPYWLVSTRHPDALAERLRIVGVQD